MSGHNAKGDEQQTHLILEIQVMLVNGVNPLWLWPSTQFSGTCENRFDYLFAQRKVETMIDRMPGIEKWAVDIPSI
jgi:hypothetical protein